MSGIIGNALTGGVPGAVSAVAQFAGKILDRAIPDPTARAAANLELARLEQTGELAQLAADVDLANLEFTLENSVTGSGCKLTESVNIYLQMSDVVVVHRCKFLLGRN